MKHSAFVLILTIAMLCLCSCGRQAPPAASANAMTRPAPTPTNAVGKKLQEYSGVGATDCGRLNLQATAVESRTAADCAMQANQRKRPFFVAYEMPGMSIGVAGDSAGKLFSVRSDGTESPATLNSGECPSQLRVAASGRVTCFSPGDMGSLGAGHTAVPPDMPNPHAFPKSK